MVRGERQDGERGQSRQHRRRHSGNRVERVRGVPDGRVDQENRGEQRERDSRCDGRQRQRHADGPQTRHAIRSQGRCRREPLAAQRVMVGQILPPGAGRHRQCRAEGQRDDDRPEQVDLRHAQVRPVPVEPDIAPGRHARVELHRPIDDPGIGGHQRQGENRLDGRADEAGPDIDRDRRDGDQPALQDHDARGVVLQPVPEDDRVSQEIAGSSDLGPGRVDAQGHDAQNRVGDPDSEILGRGAPEFDRRRFARPFRRYATVGFASLPDVGDVHVHSPAVPVCADTGPARRRCPGYGSEATVRDRDGPGGRLAASGAASPVSTLSVPRAVRKTCAAPGARSGSLPRRRGVELSTGASESPGRPGRQPGAALASPAGKPASGPRSRQDRACTGRRQPRHAHRRPAGVRDGPPERRSSSRRRAAADVQSRFGGVSRLRRPVVVRGPSAGLQKDRGANSPLHGERASRRKRQSGLQGRGFRRAGARPGLRCSWRTNQVDAFRGNLAAADGARQRVSYRSRPRRAAPTPGPAPHRAVVRSGPRSGLVDAMFALRDPPRHATAHIVSRETPIPPGRAPDPAHSQGGQNAHGGGQHQTRANGYALLHSPHFRPDLLGLAPQRRLGLLIGFRFQFRLRRFTLAGSVKVARFAS